MTTPSFIVVHRTTDNIPIFVAVDKITAFTWNIDTSILYADITHYVKESPECILKLIKGE
jgi:hypothetical protein